MSDDLHTTQGQEEDPNLPPSKSAIKREAEHLKAIGTRLLTLNAQQRESIPMSLALQGAIEEGLRIKSHEALRRHKQFIGKVLRSEDMEAILAALDNIENAHALHTRTFHQLESLRDRLIQGEQQAIGEVIAQFRDVDTQKLRQLVRNARKEATQSSAETEAKASHTHARKLFRFLRDTREQHL